MSDIKEDEYGEYRIEYIETGLGTIPIKVRINETESSEEKHNGIKTIS